MKEIVVDTNVLISALISPSGPPRKILLKIAAGEVGLIISPTLLLELLVAISKPKLRSIIPERSVADLVTLIHQSARIVKPGITLRVCRDPKDNPVLECAVAGRADSLVTGDEDILSLGASIRGIPLLTPKKFLASL